MAVDLESFEDLAAALLAGVDDDGPDRAAVQLLIETSELLRSRRFVTEYIDLSEEEPGVAWVDWEGMAGRLHEGMLMWPARELALLRIMLSLVGTAPVLLADLADLTPDYAAAVARAVVTAARADQRVEVLMVEQRSW
ncbi:hypothetical protein SUDANB121_05957 (plasmid) [Nocardiopsis dassonvillei]